MKKAITVLALLYSMATLAQISIGTVEEKKPAPQQVEKPLVYDSLSDFQLQSNTKNYKQYVGYRFYLPPKANSEAEGPILFTTHPKSTTSNADDIYDTYYTLLGGKTGASLKTLPNADKLYIYHSEKKLSYISPTFIYFMMRNEKVGDTLYWKPNEDEDFILEPYFVKQKSLCEKKQFYDAQGVKYTCKEVTLLKKSQVEQYVSADKDKYVMCYVFINDKSGNESRYHKDPIFPEKRENNFNDHLRVFISEKEFIKKEQDKKKNEQMLKAEREAEIAKDKANEKAQYEALVKKYGQANTDLIAKGIVKIGFTKEMCADAWGIRFKSSKLINDQGTLETWQYSATHILYFTNGILTQIIE